MAGSIVESVTLNFTDLTGSKTGCTVLGSNKFWKGWVEDNGNGTANFECRWGPTGEKGNDKGSVRGTTLQAATDQLRRKVREKEAKGYTRLQVRMMRKSRRKQRPRESIVAGAATASPVVTSSSAKFHPEVGRLLGIIYNETSRVVRAGLSAQAGATADNPIGNLSDSQLDIGGAVLEEIETLLVKEFGRESSGNRAQAFPLVRGVPNDRIIDLTNRFMSNVPREIGRDLRGRDNLHRLVISSYDRLGEQRKFLQLLRDVHLTKAVFAAAAHTPSAVGKESVWYDGLNCSIDICESGSVEFKRIAEIFNSNQSQRNANWFRGGRNVLRVARVFKFIRNGTEARFEFYTTRVTRKPGAVGKIMAWHGTRTENLLGISKSGLLMPENLPRGVQISGKAFGRGIYHAPVTTNIPTIHGVKTDGTNGALKSMNYTSATGDEL